MDPNDYAAIFALLGIGYLLAAASIWTKAHHRPTGRPGFTNQRDQFRFNGYLAAGVFFSCSGLCLQALSGN